jgi:hypothetical protein
VYVIGEGVAPGAKPGAGEQLAAYENLFSPDYSRAARALLREELGGETCTAYPNGVLLPVQGRRVSEVVGRIVLVRVFDNIDFGSRVGRPTRLYHVLEVSDAPLGLLATPRGDVLWLHR